MMLTTLALLSTVNLAPAQAPPPPTPPPAPPAPHMRGRGPGGPGGPGGPHDPLRAQLFPPEMIMQHQADIGLSSAQRKAVVKEIKSAQAALVELQFDVKAAEAELVRQVKASKIDEAKAMAQADKLMAAETKLKRTHLTMLLRIKNVLTAAQQNKLRERQPH